MTKEFDARNENKSRSVCAAMAEAADTGKRVLTERERAILDMWPRYEDGEPVWFGDGAAVNVGNIAIEAIEFTDGCAYVKDGACGDYKTLVQVFKHVKRPAPEVLDADGVEIHVGDTVYGVGRSQHSFDVIDPHHIDPEVGEAFSVRCYDRDEGEECHCRPELLTHDLPDSWERLEEDAVKVVCEYAGAVPDEFGDYDCDTCRLFDARGNLICEQLMTREIVRRAKAIAGVEVDG